MSRIINGIKVLIAEEEIKKTVSELSKKITRDYPNGVHLLGVLNGCFIFMADLARSLEEIEVTHDFLGRSSYREGIVSSGTAEKTFEMKLPIEGKDVLLVEDIVDTGVTLSQTIAELRELKPRSLKIAALCSKPSRRKVNVNVDYLGFEVPDKFVVGYGLDAGEKHRNLKFIGYIEDE